MPPLNNSGKALQSRQDYEAARNTDRFFCEVKQKAVGIRELAEAQCFAVLVHAVSDLQQLVADELNRRKASRVKQLELEGLLTASDRAAMNQALFSL